MIKTEEINFKAICDLATSIMNISDEDLKSSSRKRHVSVLRQVVAMIGRNEQDIHKNIIAKVLNRDRTSINYYEHSHKPNLATYPLYRETFVKVLKAYKDITSTKDIFIDKQVMKSFLLQNGVKESENSDMKLKVKSGVISCIIKTSYFEFSKQLEIINLALQNYHYTVVVI